MQYAEGDCTIQDGKLFVRGGEETFEKLPDRSVYFNVNDLKLFRSFRFHDGNTSSLYRFRGKGLFNGDTIGVAGGRAATQELSFTCIPNESGHAEYDWHVSFAYIPSNQQSGTDATWYCEAMLPVLVFDDLVASYKESHCQSFAVGCKPNLWAAEGSSHLPISHRIDWKIAPESSGEFATGVIEQFIWEVVPLRQFPDQIVAVKGENELAVAEQAITPPATGGAEQDDGGQQPVPSNTKRGILAGLLKLVFFAAIIGGIVAFALSHGK